MSEENKIPRSKNWVLTVNKTREDWLPEIGQLVTFFEEQFELYAFQMEEGEETLREHYQCVLKLKWSTRKQTLLNKVEKYFPGNVSAFQFEIMRGSWEEGVKYATKEETRIGVPVSNLPLYDGCDVRFLEDTTRRYLWQTELLDELCIQNSLHFKTADDRKIYWITDRQGNSGKSKFTKFMCLFGRNCVKVPFGTATQMRSAIVAMGPQRCYFIDIPRTLGRDDDMHSVISLIEDLKNGFVVSSMYGKNQQLLMKPPHVVVFTNKDCPVATMSQDRWIEFRLIFNKFHKVNTDGTTTPADCTRGTVTT